MEEPCCRCKEITESSLRSQRCLRTATMSLALKQAIRTHVFPISCTFAEAKAGISCLQNGRLPLRHQSAIDRAFANGFGPHTATMLSNASPRS